MKKIILLIFLNFTYIYSSAILDGLKNSIEINGSLYAAALVAGGITYAFKKAVANDNHRMGLIRQLIIKEAELNSKEEKIKDNLKLLSNEQLYSTVNNSPAISFIYVTGGSLFVLLGLFGTKCFPSK